MCILKTTNNLYDFKIEINAGGVVHQNHPNYQSSYSAIIVNRVANTNQYTSTVKHYSEQINLTQNQMLCIENLTIKYLRKFNKCCKILKNKKSLEFLSGAYYNLKITINNLNLDINCTVNNLFITKTCNKFRKEIYKIIK